LKELFLTLLWIVFITDSILLIMIVLLQSGRGGGLSGMLGGGGGGMAESALGPKTGLPRITGIMAGIFFMTAILIGGLNRPKEILNPDRPKTDAGKTEETGTPTTKAEPGAKQDETKATTATPAKTATSTAPTPKAAPGTATTTPGTTP